eukprot:TRINITY_DN21388_c0_g1_i1.p1 TRINITY_DN21388_c0_g1~~TRINITY_DN21388_c0_g1_i1.p1  ORF type:complete len:1847 (+),score=313.79 TRINITY_DN21388_c0_g1_i1:40-5580(+)
MWTCNVCTLVNEGGVTCNVCGTERQQESSGWVCNVCTLQNSADSLCCMACGVPAGPSSSDAPAQWICDACTALNEDLVLACTTCGQQRTEAPNTPQDVCPAKTSASSGEWICSSCTLANDITATACAICTTLRPSAPPPVPVHQEVSLMHNETHTDSVRSTARAWVCSTCTMRNRTDADMCSACCTKRTTGNAEPQNITRPLSIMDQYLLHDMTYGEVQAAYVGTLVGRNSHSYMVASVMGSGEALQVSLVPRDGNDVVSACEVIPQPTEFSATVSLQHCDYSSFADFFEAVLKPYLTIRCGDIAGFTDNHDFSGSVKFDQQRSPFAMHNVLKMSIMTPTVQVPAMLELCSEYPFSTSEAINLLGRELNNFTILDSNAFKKDNKLFVQVTQHIIDQVRQRGDFSLCLSGRNNGSNRMVHVVPRSSAVLKIQIDDPFADSALAHCTLTDGRLHLTEMLCKDARYLLIAMGLLCMHGVRSFQLTNLQMMPDLLKATLMSQKICESFKESEINDRPPCPRGEHCTSKHCLTDNDVKMAEMEWCCSMSEGIFGEERYWEWAEVQRAIERRLPDLLKQAKDVMAEHNIAMCKLEEDVHRARVMNDVEEAVTLEGKLSNYAKQQKDFASRIDVVSTKRTWGIPFGLRDMRVFVRELGRMKAKLPILAERNRVVSFIKENKRGVIILDASPGSGKSTQMFQYLVEELGVKDVVCTQPNCFSLKTLQQRVEKEMGYAKATHVFSSSFWTDREYLQHLSGGNHLPTAIVVDELHERSVATDCLLPLLKKELEAGSKTSKRLYVVLSSATMDVESFQDYFWSSEYRTETMSVTGRVHPVDVRYPLVPEPDNYLQVYQRLAFDKVESVLRDVPDPAVCHRMKQRDLLVFLPTSRDVFEVKEKLERGVLKDKTEVFALCETMREDQKQRVFRQCDKIKVILATGIAETSLTIEGVIAVIDTGLVAAASYMKKKQKTEWHIGFISQGSAKQRAGRAGRTCPGVCHRLYSHDTYNGLQEHCTPEILRTDPTDSLLRVNASLGCVSLQHIDFVSRPSDNVLQATTDKLLDLELLQSEYGATRITDVAKEALEIQNANDDCKLSIKEALFLLLCGKAHCMRLAKVVLVAWKLGFHAPCKDFEYEPSEYASLGDLDRVIQAYSYDKLADGVEVPPKALTNEYEETNECTEHVIFNLVRVFPETLTHVASNNLYNYPRAVVAPVPEETSMEARAGDTLLCLDLVEGKPMMLVRVSDEVLASLPYAVQRQHAEARESLIQLHCDHVASELLFITLQRMSTGVCGWLGQLEEFGDVAIDAQACTVTLYAPEDKLRHMKLTWEMVKGHASNFLERSKLECAFHENNSVRMVIGDGYAVERVLWDKDETLSVSFGLMDKQDNSLAAKLHIECNVEKIRRALCKLIGNEYKQKVEEAETAYRVSGLVALRTACFMYLKEMSEFHIRPRQEFSNQKVTSEAACLTVMSAAQCVLVRPPFKTEPTSSQLAVKEAYICLEETLERRNGRITLDKFVRLTTNCFECTTVLMYTGDYSDLSFGIYENDNLYLPAGTTFLVGEPTTRDNKTIYIIAQAQPPVLRRKEDSVCNSDTAWHLYTFLAEQEGVVGVKMNKNATTGELHGKVSFCSTEAADEFHKKEVDGVMSSWQGHNKLQTRKAPGCDPPICTLDVFFYPTQPLETVVQLKSGAMREDFACHIVEEAWGLGRLLFVAGEGDVCHETFIEQECFQGKASVQHVFEEVDPDYDPSFAAGNLSLIVSQLAHGQLTGMLKPQHELAWFCYSMEMEDPVEAERLQHDLNALDFNPNVGYCSAVASSRLSVAVPIPYDKLVRLEGYINMNLSELQEASQGLRDC